MNNISTIIFDYGCVISLPQDKNALVELMGRLGLDDAGIYRELYLLYRDEIDSGIITASQYWEKTTAQLGISLSPGNADELASIDIHSWTKINPQTVDLVEKLSIAGNKLAILSNMTHETLAVLQRDEHWLAFFQHRFFSCHLGMVKPDARIYKHCLSEMKVQPGECIFIDDSYANCQAAAELGIHSIHFNGLDNLKMALTTAGIQY